MTCIKLTAELWRIEAVVLVRVVVRQLDRRGEYTRSSRGAAGKY